MSSRSQTHLGHSANTIALDTHNTLKTLNTNIATLNTHNDGVEAGLTDLSNKIGVDSSGTPLSLTALTRVQKDLIDQKLGSIQTFLDKDSGTNFHNAQIHTKLDQANTHHTTAHGHQTTAHGKQDTIIAHHLTAHGKLDTINTTNTSNNSALVSIRDVNLPQIHNDLVGVSGFTSGSNTALVNIRDTNLPQIHNDLVGIDTAIDEAKDAVNLLKNDNGARLDTLNTTIGGTTNVRINETNTILTNKTQFSMEAPPIYSSPTTLGNTNRLDNSASAGLSDTIDMDGFRSLGFSVKYTANSGQDLFSDINQHIYIFASFDNSEFFNTGSSVGLVEHNISGSSGTYRGFGSVSNFSARYLKLGGNVGGSGFSACEVKFVRTNGGF